MVGSINDKANMVIKERREGMFWRYALTADKGWSIKQHAKGIHHPPFKL